MTDLTPREIVSELDRFIIGQKDAKRAVAVALRNRWRRRRLADDIREEVYPKNILMIGPTGVGKTEISRRLARLAKAPFLKVEATKFTEVGYVGRDVEQIVRDLVEAAIAQTRERKRKDVAARAQLAAEERVVNALVGEHASATTKDSFRRRLRAEYGLETSADVRVVERLGPAIPKFASECDADLVALATHGRGASRLIMGSVADKVIRAGPGAILIQRSMDAAEQSAMTIAAAAAGAE